MNEGTLGNPEGLNEEAIPRPPNLSGCPPPNSQAPQIQLTPDKGGTGGLWLKFRAMALSADSAPPQVTPKGAHWGLLPPGQQHLGWQDPGGSFAACPGHGAVGGILALLTV